jgi:hypothetical protein
MVIIVDMWTLKITPDNIRLQIYKKRESVTVLVDYTISEYGGSRHSFSLLIKKYREI